MRSSTCARLREFAEDHVPGALNAAGARRRRARRGRHAVQAGLAVRRQEARRGAGGAQHRRATSRRRSCRRDKGWRPLVYCWRGGKRSGAMAHILREIGWRAAQLDGGYKSYRREVVAQLETPAAHAAVPRDLRRDRQRQEPPARGAGGARRAGARPRSGWPRIAARCSAACPGEPQPAQKMFETRVWNALRRFDTDVPVFVEAESKKIGQLQVPEALILAMRASPCVRIEADVPSRVAFLLEDYGHFLADPARAQDAARLPGGAVRPRDHRRVEGARRPRRIRRAGRLAAGGSLRPGLPPVDGPQLRRARGRAGGAPAEPLARGHRPRGRGDLAAVAARSRPPPSAVPARGTRVPRSPLPS